MRTLKEFSLLLALVLLLFVGTHAQAEFTVSDPNGVFADVARKSSTASASSTFDRALTCGTSKPYVATHSRCEIRCTMMCVSRCEVASGFEAKFKMHIEECTADSVAILGDNGRTLSVTKTEFEAGSRTIVLPLLKSLGQWIQPEGSITLKDLWPARASKIEGGVMKRADAYELRAEISFGPGTQTESLFLILDLNKTGLDQVLAMGLGIFDGGNPSIFIKERTLVPSDPPGGIFR